MTWCAMGSFNSMVCRIRGETAPDSFRRALRHCRRRPNDLKLLNGLNLRIFTHSWVLRGFSLGVRGCRGRRCRG